MKAIESVRLEECHGIESWNGENGVASKLRTPKVLIRSSPALLPSPLGLCDLCRGLPARSIREQGVFARHGRQAEQAI